MEIKTIGFGLRRSPVGLTIAVQKGVDWEAEEAGIGHDFVMTFKLWRAVTIGGIYFLNKGTFVQCDDGIEPIEKETWKMWREWGQIIGWRTRTCQKGWDPEGSKMYDASNVSPLLFIYWRNNWAWKPTYFYHCPLRWVVSLVYSPELELL